MRERGNSSACLDWLCWVAGEAGECEVELQGDSAALLELHVWITGMKSECEEKEPRSEP